MAARALKQSLRKQVKAAIKGLNDAEKQRQSELVVKRLLRSEVYQKSERVCVFLSMHDEIRTSSLLDHMFSSGKKCFVPRYESTSNHMDFLHVKSIQDYESLPETAWKIKQPDLDDNSRENCLDTENYQRLRSMHVVYVRSWQSEEQGGVDLIVMPGLAFSPTGNRLGRGRGYYDTFLSKYQARVGKLPHLVAMAYNEQVVEDVPTDEHDVPVDLVMWEKDGKE